MRDMTNSVDAPRQDRQQPPVAEPPPAREPQEPGIRDPNHGEPPLYDPPKPNQPARPIKEPLAILATRVIERPPTGLLDLKKLTKFSIQ